MKTIQYFQHDYDARHDEKLTKLRRILGGEGLGIFWCVIECLYNNGGKLPFSEVEEISYDLRFTKETVLKVIKDFGLFGFDNDKFWSNTVISRLKERKNISEKRREAAYAMHRKKDGFDANAKQMQSKCTTFATNLQMQTPCTGAQEIINIKDIKDKSINNNIESKDSLSVCTDSKEKINYIEIVSFYNNSVKGTNIPECVKLTEKRKQMISARVKEYGIEKVYEAIQRCAQSDFCNAHNDRNWHANFEFVFNANKMANILEGKYDNIILTYGYKSNSNDKRAQQQGQLAFVSTIEEIQERRRTQGIVD